jgi:hypothetical protein
MAEGMVHAQGGLAPGDLHPDQGPALLGNTEDRVHIHRRVPLFVQLANDNLHPIRLVADGGKMSPTPPHKAVGPDTAGAIPPSTRPSNLTRYSHGTG